MSTRMLIDARHPEETRVTIVNGNRVEEFDFETATKKQLKGNIYLAKVTRVEPSLQAAFVEYGGNRHGFLPFSEIHPDYYQIPIEDREAIMAEEAEFALKAAEEEDAEEEQAAKKSEKPKRTRRPRKSAAKKDDASEADADKADGDAAADKVEAKDSETKDEDAKEKKPVRRTRRTSKVKKADDGEDASASSDLASSDGEKEKKPAKKTRAKAKDKVIKAEADDGDKIVVEASTDASDTSEGKEGTDEKQDDKEEKKSKPRRRTRRSAKPKTEDKAESSEDIDAQNAKKPESDEDQADDQSSTELNDDEVPNLDENDDDNDNDDNDDNDNDDDDDEDIKDQIRRRQLRALKRRYKIQEVIKRGQVILIQVVKEERGNKGAALTSYLSIPGRYCVLMPNTTNGGGISRKIANHRDRKQLKSVMSSLSVPTGMGCIIRTAGLKRTKTEIKRDFDYLIRIWNNIRKLTLESVAPATIYNEGNLIKRSIRDLYGRGIDEILVEGEEGFNTAKDFMKMLMPTHAKKVVHYKNNIPLYQRYQVESQLESMFNPVVTLKSGGYLVINPTEALIAIDVNSGKATRQHNIEETAISTNLEAAAEIGRQLRLRDMAGLVVVDFIDMEHRGNNRKLENAMKDALKTDRARVQVGRISSLGLMEMSRQRLRPNLVENSTTSCPHCDATGRIRSVESSALLVIRALEEEGIRGRSSNLKLMVATQICTYLLNQKRSTITDLEQRFGLSIHIEPSNTIISPSYEIERSGNSRNPEDISQPITADVVSSQEHSEEAAEEAAEEVETQGETSREDRPARSRSRRRRNRGPRNRNHDRSSENDTDEKTDTTVEAKSEGDSETKSDGDDDNKGRRGQQGRRGSRRSRYHTSNRSRRDRNDNNGDGNSDAKTDKPVEANADNSSADVKTDKPSEATKDRSGEADKPTRRGRKPKADVSEAKPDVKVEAKPEVKAEPKVEEKAKAKAESRSATESDPAKPKRKGWWSRVTGD